MKQQMDVALAGRIGEGKVSRQDVARRLAELAFGDAGDCVRLALEEKPEVDKLDLSLLAGVKRSEKGAVEVKLVDRLQALELLTQLACEPEDVLEEFLLAAQGGRET